MNNTVPDSAPDAPPPKNTLAARLRRRLTRPKAYVVNRKIDADRRVRTEKMLAPYNLDVEFFAAVDAHGADFDLNDYAKELRNGWYGMPDFKLGAVGCSLSHIAIWRKIAAGDAPFAFVFEDDIILLRDPRSAAKHMKKVDLLFVNQRMAEDARMRHPSESKIVEVSTIMRRLAEDVASGALKNIRRDPGTDGYCVTKAGARALLQKYDEFGIPGDVDHFMIGSVMRLSDIPDVLPPLLESRPHYGLYRRMASDHPIAAASLRNPIVSCFGNSTIKHDHRIPLEAK